MSAQYCAQSVFLPSREEHALVHLSRQLQSPNSAMLERFKR